MFLISFSEESGVFPGLWDNLKASDNQNSLEVGISPWKVQALAALKVAAVELKSTIFKVHTNTNTNTNTDI